MALQHKIVERALPIPFNIEGVPLGDVDGA
jgi:hypothetical protein